MDKTQGPCLRSLQSRGEKGSVPRGGRDQGDWPDGKVQEGFLEELVLHAAVNNMHKGRRKSVLAEGAAREEVWREEISLDQIRTQCRNQ